MDVRRGRLRLTKVVTDPVESAKLAGLRYVSETGPGFRRRRAGRGFVYVDAAGRRVRDLETIRRIRALVIPPAWTDVWICLSPHGHIQAVGRDARGRKQYRYHARWRAARTVVRLLETTLIRVGNEEYARANGSFGLTTLRGRHVDVNGHEVRFTFRGKGGKEHAVGVRDRRVARILRHLQDLPGQELFQYLDESGQRRTLDSADVNAYLHEITGEDFTAKDFRTWAGTVLAALGLAEVRTFASEREARRNIVRAVERVAARLGNTPAICRKCYVHPDVLQAYLDGTTVRVLKARTEPAGDEERPGLGAEERVVLGLLQSRLARPGPARAA